MSVKTVFPQCASEALILDGNNLYTDTREGKNRRHTVKNTETPISDSKMD